MEEKVIILLFAILLGGDLLSQTVSLDLDNYSRVDSVYNENFEVSNILCYNEGSLYKKITFYKQGNISSILSFNGSGLFDGDVIYWFENGELKSSVVYKDGIVIGDKNYGWYENGRMEYSIVNRQDTLITESLSLDGKVYLIEKSIAKTGEIVYEERRTKKQKVLHKKELINSLYQLQVFHCNGRKKIVAFTNKFGTYVGDFKEFNKKGRVILEGSYQFVDGFEEVREGLWNYYDKKGRLLKSDKY